MLLDNLRKEIRKIGDKIISKDLITYKKVLDTLKDHDRVDLVTENGITIMSVEYIEASTLELDDGNIYLVVYAMCDDCVKLNYKAVKRIRVFDECIELTI